MLRIPFPDRVARDNAVSSRKFKAQHVKARVSDPRLAACLDLKMPFEGSKLLGPLSTLEC